MNLYLLKTPNEVYATNAENATEAKVKFKEEYPDYYVDLEKVKKIPVETLVRLGDNDSIIFF